MENDLTQVKYVGPALQKHMRAKGIHTVAQLATTPEADLQALPGVGQQMAPAILASAQSLVAPVEKPVATETSESDPKDQNAVNAVLQCLTEEDRIAAQKVAKALKQMDPTDVLQAIEQAVTPPKTAQKKPKKASKAKAVKLKDQEKETESDKKAKKMAKKAEKKAKERSKAVKADIKKAKKKVKKQAQAKQQANSASR